MSKSHKSQSFRLTMVQKRQGFLQEFADKICKVDQDR
jgi:hypothetical protein